MKSLLKNCGIIFVIITLILCLTLNTSAYIECDGNVNAYEWKNVDDTILFEKGGHSGCCYHSAYVKYKYIEEDRRVYLAVFLDNFNNTDFNGNASEIIVSFNDSSEVIMRSDLSSEYNEDAFFLKFGYFSDDVGGGTYESEIVLKELEYDNTLILNLTLRDYHGNSSQIYRLNIKSEEFKEEESESLSKAEKESEKESEKQSREEARNKTPKKSSSKTTKKKTTTEKESTTEFKTAILTESYKSYSETLEENNRSILIIGIACVVTSVSAMCIALFRKNK